MPQYALYRSRLSLGKSFNEAAAVIADIPTVKVIDSCYLGDEYPSTMLLEADDEGIAVVRQALTGWGIAPLTHFFKEQPGLQ